MKSEILRIETALFKVKLSPRPSTLNRSFDGALTCLGVFLRADGYLRVEEWEATTHPATGLPFLKVATIHARVDRRKLSTLACGNPDATLESLQVAITGLARGNHEGLLDEIGACSEDSASNEHRYPPTRIDLWPSCAEKKFAVNLSSAAPRNRR